LDGKIGLVEIVNEQWKADVSDLLQQETDRLKALARAEVDDFWVTHYKVHILMHRDHLIPSKPIT
jgi:hypothetical protein